MANLQGINHALRKKIAQLDVVIEELGSELGDTANNLAEAQNVIRALKNPDMVVNGAPNLTLEQVQVMENGDIRVILPPTAPGPDTCTQEKNGKKPDKELANVS
tara:strand:- start:41 stop:352 length:312 start_codon:yes stop_codon:yes gene_type:complete